MVNIAEAANTANQATNGLVPNIATFIAAIISLFILVMVVSYFAYFPVRDFVRARRKYVKDNIDISEKANKDAQMVLAKANEKLSHSREQGKEILKEYEERASHKKNMIVSKANEEAMRIIEEANKRIKQEEARMKENLSEEISLIAIQAAEKLIKENLSSDSNKKMIDEFIKEIKE